LRLDQLTDDEFPDPVTSVWIGADGEADLQITLTAARERVSQAVNTILSDEERLLVAKGPFDKEYVVCIVTPKASLIGKLLEDNAQPFVDCVASNLEILAKPLPVLDKALDYALGSEGE